MCADLSDTPDSDTTLVGSVYTSLGIVITENVADEIRGDSLCGEPSCE